MYEVPILEYESIVRKYTKELLKLRDDYLNNKVNGYAICIINNYYKDGIRRAFLIDLISVDKSSNVSINLIGSCIKEAKKRNCDTFEFRGFDKSKKPYIEFFNPFKKKLSDNPFYYKSNNASIIHYNI